VSLLREFKDGCATLRAQLLGARTPLVADGKTVDAAYIARYWPGGELNDRKDLKGWARCYGVLVGLTRLFDKTTNPAERAAKRAAVLDAIAEVPEVVELVRRDAEGAPLSLTVYQKSDVALRVIHGINLQLAEMVDAYALFTEHGTREHVDLLPRILAEQSYLQRVIVWVACTKGAGLPFEEGELRPALPPQFDTLHPLDFYSVAQAFQRVNVAGFAALESSTSPRTRPDWSVFWSGLEFELKTPATRLMRDRGLLSLVATASEQSRGREEAMAKAERERKKVG
jgi:hypothetical protein